MNKKNNTEDNKQNDLDKPDPETLHTTDPQEHMEGPISSIVQSVKENVEETGGERKDGDDESSR